jgi:hypothetical protein
MDKSQSVLLGFYIYMKPSIMTNVCGKSFTRKRWFSKFTEEILEARQLYMENGSSEVHLHQIFVAQEIDLFG